MSAVRLTGIRLIVFDLDDTLYPERAFVMSGFEAVGQWLRSRIPCPADPAARMRALFEAGVRGRIFDRLLEEWGVDRAASLVPEMVACYRRHAPAIRLFDDAVEALDRWSGRFRLALITDGPADAQRNKVAALGLQARLDPCVYTGDWGTAFWKPHPRAFEAVEGLCGVSGQQCLYIGDNPSKDFVAPRGRGWQSVLVRRPGAIHGDLPSPPGGEPDHQVGSLRPLELNS